MNLENIWKENNGMAEHWKDISGYEGLYSVSDTGLVKTHIYNKILKPPDIYSYPYCADHLEEAMVDMAKAVWKDDKGMQAVAIAMAQEAVRRKYRKEK